MMKKKILFTDLDNTLLKNDKTVSQGNIEAIHKTLQAGNYFVIATGRAIASVWYIYESLQVDGRNCYIIAYNGSQIYDCQAEQIIQSHCMDRAVTEYLYREADRAGIHIQTYNETDILSRSETFELLEYGDVSRTPYKIEPLEKSLTRPLPKLLMINSDHNKLLRFKQEHEAALAGKCNIFFSVPEYLEFSPVGATKGDAVEYMRTYLNLEEDSTIAIGDEENDISMIKAAHLGVAMSNANPTVKAIADHMTLRDNEHDGVAEIIYEYML